MSAFIRKSLPQRRFTETRRIEIPRGQTVHLSVGYDPKSSSRPREVFYSAGLKSGSDLEYHMQDMCVLISLLLQHDMDPSDIAHSLSRRELETGGVTYASLVGLVVDEIRNPPEWPGQLNGRGQEPSPRGEREEFEGRGRKTVQGSSGAPNRPGAGREGKR
ncbi:hypothetical protein [Ruegeria sp. HKCCD8929]|uniref:TSCPD domain-containing protein n=1 Tax=Ruegeria sp. HKCCD8929 TaxID=2683006 RepID=UPI0014893EEA|nr:hypothetical protein [Ruegeria sp. HKCCD8929]